MQRFRFAAMVAMLVVSTMVARSSHAEAVISFGNGGVVDLSSNSAGQEVQFFVTGITEVDGLEFNIQIGDGGADLGGTSMGPVITDIDLITGTIFENSGPNQNDVVSFARARQSTVDTSSKVTSDGLIGTVTFDTTGVDLGDYDLLLTGVAGQFDTTFFNGVPTVTTTASNGTLRVAAIPEPSSMLVFAAIGTTVAWRTRRKRLQASRQIG